MKPIFTSVVAVLVVGCGTARKHDNITPVPEEIITKAALYKDLSSLEADSYGMYRVGGSVGDSILFSCIRQYATGQRVNVLKSFNSDGLPIRHPDAGPDDAATPISRDMILGFMLCAISGTDGPEIMNRIVKAGKDNTWDLCGAAPEYNISIKLRLSRCYASPNLISTIYKVHKYVGNSCDTICKVAIQAPLVTSSSVIGFQRHLAVVHSLIVGTVSGLNENNLDVLSHHAEREPGNALFQGVLHMFSDGNQEKAISLILDNTRFPEHTLPTSGNYCTPYLYERDYSARDWHPCPSEGRTHLGIDFLFASKVVQ